MNNNINQSNKVISSESFLWSLLNKVIKEYKNLLHLSKQSKNFKIAEIIYLSKTPGETKFAIQLTNKNCILKLTAAEIIQKGYNLNDFYDFHADLIRYAFKGKLIEFLVLSGETPKYKIVSKKYEHDTKSYLFTIEAQNNVRFLRTAAELSKEKDILIDMSISDIYDIGYSHGSESIIKEKTALLLTSKNK